MKKIVLVLLIVALSLTAMIGCERVPQSVPGGSTGSSAESTPASDEPSEPESPVSDFEYAENEDGGITITKYIGTDKHVVIPAKIDGKNVTVIGDHAFAESKIISVKMPDSVIKLGEIAFQSCLSLTEVRFSQNLKSIEAGSFIACIALPSVELPQSLEKIGDHAFEHCLKLSDVTLPSNLKHLGMKAFYETILKQINIPKSIETWGSDSFWGTPIETIELEQGLKIIGDSAFTWTKIKEIIIPDSVTVISDHAFSWCNNLERVILNEGLVSIGFTAFGGTSKLKEIVIPSTVKEMNEMAFSGADSLEKVKFEGNAPKLIGDKDENVHYTVYYHSESTGFTSPEWSRYLIETW